MWTQLVNPNTGITYTGGLCEKAEENTFGQTGIFPSATLAWNAEASKHYDQPPSGVAVPVYFSIAGEPDGHVATKLANGTVASSSQAGTHKGLYIHSSIADLINFYSTAWKLTYLGWGESVGRLKVVKQGEVMSKSNLPTARQLAYSILGADGRDGRSNAMLGSRDDDLNKNHVNADLTVGYLNTLYDSAEAQNYRKLVDAAYAERDKLRLQVADLQKQLDDNSAQYVKLTDIYIKK